MAELVNYRGEQRKPSASRAAVAFLHGFTGKAEATWATLARYLAAEPKLANWDLVGVNYSTRLLPDLMGIWSADADIAHIATLFAGELLDGALKGYGAYAIVAHSMGGLVAQQALLARPELARRTTHLVMFGTPSSGLRKARFVNLLKPQARDMQAGGTFVTGLRQRWQETFGDEPPFDLLVIAGERDQFVPPSSSLEPFPSGHCRVVPGNHITMIRPDAAGSLAVALTVNTLCDTPYSISPLDSARLAAELKRYDEVVRTLWDKRDGLDSGGRVLLALALEATGRRQDALDVLEKGGEDSTEAMGVLAGRLKREWLVSRQKADGDRTLDLYTRAFEQAEAAGNHPQAYYNGINAAFMQLVYKQNKAEARSLAARVLEHTAAARAADEHDRWLPATEGEALLVLGRAGDAVSRYGDFVAGVAEERELESAYRQAQQIATALDDKPTAERLAAVFRQN